MNHSFERLKVEIRLLERLHRAMERNPDRVSSRRGTIKSLIIGCSNVGEKCILVIRILKTYVTYGMLANIHAQVQFHQHTEKSTYY